MDFVSFILENGLVFEKAVVFGKSIEDEYDFESKIELLIKTNEKGEADAKKLRKLFYKIHGEKWAQQGIVDLLVLRFNAEIKKGIVLFADYEGESEPAETGILLALDFTRIKRSDKVSAWRKLYGYSQTVNGKIYSSKGLVDELGGEKLEKGVIKVPHEKLAELEKFLKEESIIFKKVWGDVSEP